MHLFSQRLGDDDPSSFINCEAGVHFGMVAWVEPSGNPILAFSKVGAGVDAVSTPHFQFR